MSFQGNFSNVKPDIRDVIPAGTPLLVKMTYTPGGYGTEAECGVGSQGALTKSKPPSDTAYLKAEFTVQRGPFKGRKFWSNMTVIGGEVDEKGNSKAAEITRKAVRLILDSSQGLSSKDESPEAAAKRVITGYRDLQGRVFVAKAKVEPAKGNYPEKNGLGQVLTIDMKDFPKSPEELDNVAKPGAAAPAPVLAAPGWANNATQSGQAATPAIVPATPAVVPATAAIVPQPPTAVPVDNGLPAWARPAA